MSRDPSFIPDAHPGDTGAPRQEPQPTPPGDFYIPSHASAPDAAPRPPVAPPPEPRAPEARPLPSVRPPTPATPTPPRESAPPSLHIPTTASARAIRKISLMPGTASPSSAGATWGNRTVIVAAIAACATVAVLWAVLAVATRRSAAATAAVEAERDVLLIQVTAARERARTLAAFTRRAAVVRTLLAEHRAWTPFFRLIESRTLPTVTYGNVQADATGMVTMSAQAPDVRTAMEQLVAWRSADLVRSAELSATSSVVDELGVTRGVRFDLRLQLNPNAFAAANPPA